ncbi:isoaspartyl peptidase/L-asparaginase isoform X2 [Neodiprion pinetum]|uniref:isoaspartyl peptidase/L-asparaginase isoform X2 n=1 Tax=Neodiprion pinetum TaxID=441929 RepID=UPI00371FCF40
MCDFCTWVNKIKAKVKTEQGAFDGLVIPPRKDPVIIVHGGAGRIPKKNRIAMLEDVKTAAIKAYTNLIRGSHVLDAVEEAICHMESQKYFNCAFGGSLDYTGDVVMDAGITDSGFQFGSVGAVRDIEHPISLARLVMHNTDHILLAEKGAQSFAVESRMSILSPGSLIPTPTPSPSLNWENEEEEEPQIDSTTNIEANLAGDKNPKYETLVLKRFPQCSPYYGQMIEEKCETQPNLVNIFEPTLLEYSLFNKVGGVGAVAYDRKGRLAAGTSTAGNQGKLNGYMSPAATVPGCGIFADQTGCVSISGHDQTIYAYAPARMFIKRLNAGEIIDEALNMELDEFQDSMCQSNIGAIALNSDGKPAVSFRSQHFLWAYCELGWLYYGWEKNQVFSEKIEGLDRPLDCMCEGVI